MNSSEVMEMLANLGAIITNSHIVLTSGRHTSTYINKDALYLHTEPTSRLCQLMADNLDASQIDVVVGPVVGSVVLCQWIAHHLNAKRSSGEILSLYADKEGVGADKRLFFHRGHENFIRGKNVLVVEDVLVTGGTARKVVELVRRYGGNVVGLSVLCNRGDVRSEDVGGVPVHALAYISLDSWAEEECPLCRQGVPINTEVGQGKAFLAKRQNVNDRSDLTG
jgi:orotate phosphoribosyltransferase